MYNYLKNILQDLDLRFSHNVQLPQTSSFIRLLNALRPVEKDYIAGYVTKKEWNLGSPNVLDILQQTGILNMTDYLLQRIEFDDPVEVQLILNELLEAKFSLLANLIENFDRTDPRSQLITQSLEEGFRRLIEDIAVRGVWVKRNFLQEIKVYLSAAQLSKLRMMNLRLLMDIDDCSLVEAIGQLSEWMDDNEIHRNADLNVVINEILQDKEKVLDCLMKKVVSEKFRGWKWYSIVLKKISSDLSDRLVTSIKLFLKEWFASFLSQKNQNYFFIMMLTARIVCNGGEGHFGDYPQWYKGQFSEMRYSLSKNDFVSTIEVLQSLVSHENNVDILEMYARTPIAPPTMCNELVLSFKQMCRSKIERLKLDRSFHKVVLIDDDSDDMEFG